MCKTSVADVRHLRYFSHEQLARKHLRNARPRHVVGTVRLTRDVQCLNVI